jgi:hypothetical protein
MNLLSAMITSYMINILCSKIQKIQKNSYLLEGFKKFFRINYSIGFYLSNLC